MSDEMVQQMAPVCRRRYFQFVFSHDSSDEMQSECEIQYFWIMNDIIE